MEKWTRKEYGTWDEAFRGLTPRIRQSSVRIASYTRELFVQACADSFAKGTHDGSARIRGKYADLAYKCGMYHQLGKALVPPEYQIFQSDFTDEEKSVYWKYMTDGRLSPFFRKEALPLKESAACLTEKKRRLIILHG